MTRILHLLPAAIAASLSLSACATAQESHAPSLAKRPVEGRFDVAPPAVVVAPPGPLPTDLAGRLARWESDAVEAERAFAAERVVAAPLVSVAAGSAVSSERWVVAQQAVSRLIATRAPLTGALAEIDRLYIDRSIEEAIDGLPEIFALRERLTEMVSAQDAVIGALEAQLPEQ